MEKFIGKSKTIWGLVMATAVMWAKPLGVDFDQEQADFLTANANELLASALAAFAAFGRFTSDVKLKLTP